MVKTMESEMDRSNSFDNDLGSDFSLISHPNEDLHNQMPNGNLDHLAHIQIPAPQGDLLQLAMIQSEEPQSGSLMTNSMIHQHLEQLLKENFELKEALQKNNATLRQHFQTLVTWQEQQSKTHSRHKQMQEDLQQTTASLQRDKTELLLKVEELTTQLQNQREELLLIVELKSQLTNRAEEAIETENALRLKNSTIETLKDEIEQQKVFTMHLQQALTELQSENESLKAEKAKLESFSKEKKLPARMSPLCVLEDDFDYAVVHHSGNLKSNQDHEIERLDSTVQALQEGKVLLMQLLQEKDGDLMLANEELVKARDQIEVLQKQKIEIPKTPEPDLMKSVLGPPDQRWTMMEQGIMSTSHDFEAASECLQKYGTRFTSVDQQLSDFQKRLHTTMAKDSTTADLEELRDEINMLRLLLKNEHETKDADKLNLEEAKMKFDSLHLDYKMLMQQWHDYQAEVQTKGRQMEYFSEIEKRQSQEQLDEVTARVMTLEETVLDKDAELMRLKNQGDVLKRETEQIPILRAQVEIYQQELYRKKEERKKTEAQIEQQKHDIHSLQSQVVQLMDEINHQSQSQLMEISSLGKAASGSGVAMAKGSPAFGRRSSSVERNSAGSSSGSLSSKRRSVADRQPPTMNSGTYRTVAEPETENQKTECPRCLLTFDGLQAINNHVQTCIFGTDGDTNPFL